MVVATMAMVLLLAVTGAALLFSRLNLKSSSNLKAGSGALHAADAGIQHALAVIPVGTQFDVLLTGSVSEFPLVNGKPTLTGSLSAYTYTVVAENDTNTAGETTTEDANRVIILTSSATGPNGAKRTIKAYIGRSSVFIPPGSVYFPGQSQYIETGFNGTSFQIDGNDTVPGGSPGSGSGSPIPGISTTSSASTSQVTSSLSSNQQPLVGGRGGTPSVATTSASLVFDVNQLAQNIIASGIEGVTMQTLPSGNYSSGVWGTSMAPMITHITGNATLTGDLTGYGVLIVDGDLTVRGSFSFKGVIIALGDVDFKGSADSGQATLWGALLAKEGTTSDSMRLTVGGNAQIFYSTQTISTVVNSWGNSFPKGPKVVGWHELM